MYEPEGVLRMYAEIGLRTVEEWIALGRDIVSDSKPRLDTLHRGLPLVLYSRDQTARRTPSRRRSRD